MSDLHGQGTAAILDAHGAPAIVPSLELTPAEAQLLRQYKTFLQRHGLREALYCNACWAGQLHDGCEAHVTPHDILIRCRCRVRTFRGPTL